MPVPLNYNGITVTASGRHVRLYRMYHRGNYIAKLTRYRGGVWYLDAPGLTRMPGAMFRSVRSACAYASDHLSAPRFWRGDVA